MSNERLERIKERVNYHGHLDDDIEWLIKQAERAVDYDNKLISIEDNKQYVSELIKQNKRYREALEKAREYLKRVPVGSHGVNKAYEIMIKAMEEEE